MKFRINYKKHKIVFAMLVLTMLLLYYLDYLYPNKGLVIIGIILGVVLNIMNLFFFKVLGANKKEAFIVGNNYIYHLDKLIVGILFMIYFFVIKTDGSEGLNNILFNLLLTLSCITCLRIIKEK